MSKSILFLFAAAFLLLNSCGGGWSDEQKEQLKNKCIGSGAYNCDCYLEAITKAHEDPETYNSLSQADKDKLVESCAVEGEENDAADEDLETF